MKVPLEIRRKVLVRGLNWVGDAIIATPALARLRRAFEGSHITLMVRPWVAAVYEHSPHIDELLVIDDSKNFWGAVGRVRSGKYDFGIILPNSFRSAAVMALGGVKRRIGYATGSRSLLLTKTIKLEKAILEGHQVHYYLRLVDWLSDLPPDPPQLTLIPGADEQEQVRKLFRDREIKPGRMRVGLAPGSINSNAKRWLPDRFAELADRLYNEAKAEVFLLGSQKEKDVVDRVEKLCKTPVCNVASDLSLAQVIALIERLHAFIGNDSGAMHLAAALKVPTVAIFGPTKWTTTGPFYAKSKIVHHPVDCAPCMLRECPIAGHPCMSGVEVREVVRSFAELAPDIKARMAAQP